MAGTVLIEKRSTIVAGTVLVRNRGTVVAGTVLIKTDIIVIVTCLVKLFLS